MFAAVSFAAAQTQQYKVGDRVECDATQMGTFKKGTIVPFPKNDPDQAGRFYYVKVDGSNITEGYLCMATHMRPLAEATPSNPETNADTPAKDSTEDVPDKPTAKVSEINQYGTRDPRTCDDTIAPTKGPITAALAKKYFICRAEKFSGYDLILVDNVTVAVGGGRPWNPQSDINYSEIDVRVPIYPIRGSYTQHMCTKEYPKPGTLYNIGKNCNRFENRNATGSCYKTTFGDWRCSMFDFNQTADDRTFQIPPPKLSGQ